MFTDGKAIRKITEMPQEVLDAVIPLVWSTKKPGWAKNTAVKTEPKLGAQPVRKKQYPVKLEARIDLESLKNMFVQYRLLHECQSEYKPPILPVKKP